MRVFRKASALPMAQNTASVKEDLNEVLESIHNASRRQYKDEDGVPYCSVTIKKLRHWYLALETAIKESSDAKTLSAALVDAQTEVKGLMEAAKATELKNTELRDLVANAEKEKAAILKTHSTMLKKLKDDLAATQRHDAEIRKAKLDTAVALQKANYELSSPTAKFDPDTAAKLSAEARKLQEDLHTANEQIALNRATQASLNKEIDALHKQVAAKEKLVEEAKANNAKFVRQLAAARSGNVDNFDPDELDYEKLKIMFGEAGLAKLRAVLEVGSWDVRGRIQRLTGFFSTIAKTTSKQYHSFAKLVTHALEVLKTSSSVWSAVLAPWVNSLLKDIVLLDIKPVQFYRLDLEAKIAAVKALPATVTQRERLAAASGTSKSLSWANVARKNSERASHLADKMAAKAKATWAYLRSLSFIVRNKITRGAAYIGFKIKQAWSAVCLAASMVGVLYGSGKTRFRTRAWRETTSETGERAEQEPILLFDSELG